MRMALRRGAVGLTAGMICTIPAAVLAVGSMGAGHGTYFVAKLLYPFAMIVAKVNGGIPLLVAMLSLLQFPLYGYLIGSWSGAPNVIVKSGILGAIHVAACCWALTPQ